MEGTQILHFASYLSILILSTSWNIILIEKTMLEIIFKITSEVAHSPQLQDIMFNLIKGFQII